MNNTQDFDVAVEKWVAKVQQLITDHDTIRYPNLPYKRTLSIEPGRRYIRVVVNSGSQRSAFAFIDKGDKDGIGRGDLLKSAGWKAPAVHARGNLFDVNDGMKYVDAYGMAYLR